MKLRWLIICNKDGLKSEPYLQFYNEFTQEWESIGIVEMKEWEDHTRGGD